MEGIAKAKSILRKCGCVSGQGTQRHAFVGSTERIRVRVLRPPPHSSKGCCLGFRAQAGSFSWEGMADNAGTKLPRTSSRAALGWSR
jgi:hypothetical protein